MTLSIILYFSVIRSVERMFNEMHVCDVLMHITAYTFQHIKKKKRKGNKALYHFIVGCTTFILQKLLWQAVRVECSASCLTTVSKLLVSYQLQLQHLPEHFDIDLCPDDMDILRSRFSKLANVQAALFPMEAIVLCCQVKDSPEAVVSER